MSVFPDNCPWETESPRNVLYEDLNNWRRPKSERLIYGERLDPVQVSLGHSEATAYVNLSYYLRCVHYQMILFQYSTNMTTFPSDTGNTYPSCQKSETGPRGPADLPLLISIPPEGRW